MASQKLEEEQTRTIQAHLLVFVYILSHIVNEVTRNLVVTDVQQART